MPRAARKSSPPKKASRPRATAGKPAAPKRPAPRADFGAPIDAFFARQPAHLRAVLEELRHLVEEAAPEAEATLKWGMPVYSIRRAMMCALGGHKSHVNLVLAGPPGTFADPEGRLSGTGKTGRHLKLTKVEGLPRAAVRGWLRAAAAVARAKG